MCQPRPGDWFREYTWTMPQHENNEAFLRVGGNLDYQQHPPTFPKGHMHKGQLLIPHPVMLDNAVKVEVMIEKNLCHDYTTGLAISFNGSGYVQFPEPAGIPEPQEAYLHHSYPVLEVPLEMVKNGMENFFSLKVDSFQHWGWPQVIVYGLVLRVYYDMGVAGAPIIEKEGKGHELELNPTFNTVYKGPDDIEQVDYIGHYHGPDMNGDGIFDGWHYGWFEGQIRYHLGTSKEKKGEFTWDNSWFPDQQKPFMVAARVKLKNSGLIHFTLPMDSLTLKRPYKITFCEPYNIPKVWTTRGDEFSSAFYFDGDKNQIETIKVVWRSWSPGYMNGIYLNDVLFFIREGEYYTYHDHEIAIRDKNIIKVLNKGANYIKTGKTPLYNWQMVHGMDVFYPGPMVLIKHK